MPPIFKALISITVWILFVKGCLGILAGTITISMASMAGATPPLAGVAECGVGIVALILAAVAAKIRQMVE